MKPSEDIKPVTYMKTRSAELIDTVTLKRRPMIITQNGEAKVVVQDIQSFERDRDALLLLKLLSQSIVEAERGEIIDQEDVFKEIEAKLAKMTTA
jgi:prevent-host-death family protein